MPTIEQQLNELVMQKTALATALRDKGVEAGDNETLNSLVGKVDGLETGGPIVPVDNYDELTGSFDLKKLIKHQWELFFLNTMMVNLILLDILEYHLKII